MPLFGHHDHRTGSGDLNGPAACASRHASPPPPPSQTDYRLITVSVPSRPSPSASRNVAARPFFVVKTPAAAARNIHEGRDLRPCRGQTYSCSTRYTHRGESQHNRLGVLCLLQFLCSPSMILRCSSGEQVEHPTELRIFGKNLSPRQRMLHAPVQQAKLQFHFVNSFISSYGHLPVHPSTHCSAKTSRSQNP